MSNKYLIHVVLAASCTSILFINALAQEKSATPIDVKIEAIIKRLTRKEKIAMVHANGLFSSAGVKRLHIPDLVCDDGPSGVREEVKPDWQPANLTTDSATFFPTGSAIAATWNPELAYRYGHDLGEEGRARGKNIMLAPAFNIARTPLNGRTYEYFSEDPFLNSRLAVSSVRGIQSQHVAACIKHFAANNQESERKLISVELDERTLQEIYLPAFKAAICEGNAWTIMSAYNKVRGKYCSENDYLLNTILKKEWKFNGFVMSDWGGTHSTVAAANHGLDVEMGSDGQYNNYFFADKLLAAVRSGKLSTKVLDDKVRRVLRVMYHTSLSNTQLKGRINTPEHEKTAYDIAAESIVLLKNEQQLLPLNLSDIKSIAVIGDNATRTFQSGGGGAGVKARYEITALQGLRNRLGHRVALNFAQGYSDVYHPAAADTHGAEPVMVSEAVAAAKKSDVAVVFIGGNRDYERESYDRKDLSLPFGEQTLVDAVSAANGKTIVVIIGGAPYDISAIKKNNHTILWSWYGGAENGNALADIIIGKVNPSGKLPFTFPASLKDMPTTAGGLAAYPGKGLTVDYKEGILVGYRWYDTKKIEPLYPFGFGLSYTTFAYGPLHTDKENYSTNDTITVTLKLKNTGNYAGMETVQLYISKPGSVVTRADKELKAFQKIEITTGVERDVSLRVPVKNLAYFDEKKDRWVVESGKYLLKAGTSSKQITQQMVIFFK